MRDLIIRISAHRRTSYCVGCKWLRGQRFCDLFDRQLHVEQSVRHRGAVHRCRACTAAEVRLVQLTRKARKTGEVAR